MNFRNFGILPARTKMNSDHEIKNYGWAEYYLKKKLCSKIMKCSCTTSTSFPLPSFTIFWVVIISFTADSRLKSSTIKYRRGCRCGPLVCHWLNCQTADKTTGQTVGHTNRNPKRHAIAKYWHSTVRPARALAATNRAEIIRKRSITSIQITERKVRTNSRPTHLLSFANGLTRKETKEADRFCVSGTEDIETSNTITR